MISHADQNGLKSVSISTDGVEIGIVVPVGGGVAEGMKESGMSPNSPSSCVYALPTATPIEKIPTAIIRAPNPRKKIHLIRDDIALALPNINFDPVVNIPQEYKNNMKIGY
jgi:hypothetical protein